MALLNEEIAALLREYAELTQITGGDVFRARNYEKAARSVRGWADDVSQLDAKGLRTIPGVGASIAAKIAEYLSTGHIAVLDELRAKIPAGVLELTKVPGLGPKRALQLSHDHHGGGHGGRPGLPALRVRGLAAAVAGDDRRRRHPGRGGRLGSADGGVQRRASGHRRRPTRGSGWPGSPWPCARTTARSRRRPGGRYRGSFGSVDWDEASLGGQGLAGFDLCVASVHSSFDQPRAEMTRRFVTACENPYVNIIGHPLTRRIGRRPPVDVDFGELFRACARTGEQFVPPPVPPGMYFDRDLWAILPEGVRRAGKGRVAASWFPAVGLFAVTLGLGYLVWAAVTWGGGQTPAQRLLGLACWRRDTSRLADRGPMALRQITGLLMTGELASGPLLWLFSRDLNSVGDFFAGTVVLHDPNQLLHR